MKTFLLSCLTLITVFAFAQKPKQYTLSSPDQAITITINAGNELTWSLMHEQTLVIQPSAIALQTSEGMLGKNVVVRKTLQSSADETFATPIYKKAQVRNHYNQLQLSCRGNWGIIFRAYDDGVAYRFFIEHKEDITIINEQATFAFANDPQGWFAYANDPRVKGDQFSTSFEGLYNKTNISAIPKDTLVLLPALISLADGKKAAIVESDLQNYAGMYLQNSNGILKARFPKVAIEEKVGGHNNLNIVVSKRGNYIAKYAVSRHESSLVKKSTFSGEAPLSARRGAGPARVNNRSDGGEVVFPWRAIIISKEDKELLNNDMVYKLAEPNRIKDVSWIQPGKVAWDWWNDWNISGVDFKSGINTATYKYYIDFAAANKLEYIIMDEGWSASADLFKLNEAVNLPEQLQYAKQKNVGIVLWATWQAVNKQMDTAFAHYAAMGVKGFKIDFLDRDDQAMVASTYAIAQKAAENKLIINYHGMFKPSGIQRTYPNVINFEGVKGLENSKWAPADDVPEYDVSIPFIRMIAGPLDYTPGAMRNATKANYRAIHTNPMSQGTRVHQLAMYIIFDAPMQMLADNPTAYIKEQESTDFIASIPTVFDETIALDGEVGEYVVMARKKDGIYYGAAMTNWSAREVDINLSFLDDGEYEATIFADGINADRQPIDYKKMVSKARRQQTLRIKLAPGGGWAARFVKVN